MHFPSAYFPSIAYLRAMCKRGRVVIDCHEHWIKQSIRNRSVILHAAGYHNLIVPIRHQPSKEAMGLVCVDDAKKWRGNHWKSIQTAYGRSPYFEFYDRDIKQCIDLESHLLLELNLKTLNFFIEIWQLPIQVALSSSFYPYETTDNRLEDWLRPDKLEKNYHQVFSGFGNNYSHISALDLLCCEGPLGRKILVDE
ncbi:MAG: hypothetical protein EB023_13885 [Flavobacteriia bacterium]|nr:hypothetical protein [Flavobacteriia bacterium]